MELSWNPIITYEVENLMNDTQTQDSVNWYTELIVPSVELSVANTAALLTLSSAYKLSPKIIAGCNWFEVELESTLYLHLKNFILETI